MPRFYRGPLILAVSLYGVAAQASDPLSSTIEANRDGNRAEAEVQRQIDTLSDAQRALFEEYDALSREFAALSKHNAQLQRMLDDQDIQRQTRQQSLTKLDETRHEMLPLMVAMADWLEQLVQADLPFHPQERRRRLAELRQFLERGDLDLSTQYEQVLAHYQQALSEGQHIEVYRGERPGDPARVVDFLKVGRLALYYQSLDGQDSAYWDAAQRQWVPLSQDDGRALTRAMRIVRKEAPPGLLRLPLDLPPRAVAVTQP